MLCYKEFQTVQDAKACIDNELSKFLGNVYNMCVVRLKNGRYTIANLWEAIAHNAVVCN